MVKFYLYRKFKFIDPFTFIDIKIMIAGKFTQKYDVGTIGIVWLKSDEFL